MPFIGRRREGSSSMLLFRGKERKGQRPFQKGKGAHGAAFGSHAEGQPEDATAQRCATATDSRSRVASGLTRGRRQPVGPKACLRRILLWRSNSLPKWDGLGKKIFLDRKKIMEKNLGCCSLNKKIQTFE
jgi:hypothetical protein